MKSDSRALTLLTVLTLLGGCAVTTANRRVDHVMAIGWTQQNHPIALAQETVLSNVFGIVTPEGAMESNQRISRGRIVLLTEESRTPVRLSFDNGKRGDFELVDARAVTGEQRFTALVSLPDTTLIFTDEYGFTIGFDGRTGVFYQSERHADYGFTPDGHRLCRLWNPPRERTRIYECVDAATGEVHPLESSMLETELAFNSDRSGSDWLPCESAYRRTRSRVSPDGTMLALSCDDGDSCTVWLIHADRITMKLTTVPTYSPPAMEGLDELEARYLYRFHTLAWSPDQSRLYFCQAPGATGYVIDIATQSTISRQSGLVQAAWSPDGTSLAGMEDNRLTIWSPVEVPSR